VAEDLDQTGLAREHQANADTHVTPEKRYPCRCCGFLTLEEEPNGSYEICPVCFWEDDPVQGRDPSFAGGANKPSLNEAQHNFRAYGVSEARFRSYVRPPHDDELPPPSRDG
jgi:hypothetical protein